MGHSHSDTAHSHAVAAATAGGDACQDGEEAAGLLDELAGRIAAKHLDPGRDAAAAIRLGQRFTKYDMDGDGELNESEVHDMMSDIGYEVDGDYMQGVLKVFGHFDKVATGGSAVIFMRPAYVIFDAPYRTNRRHGTDCTRPWPFDKDLSGSIEFAEFKLLWEHLGGEDRMAAKLLPVEAAAAGLGGLAAPPAAASPPAGVQPTQSGVSMASPGPAAAPAPPPKRQPSASTFGQRDALRATFDKYDGDGDGRMNEAEVHAMMTDIGYSVGGDYLAGVLKV
jgi:Ca2+-binding EF-hand superfamily protein